MKLVALGLTTIGAIVMASPLTAACSTSDIHIKNWKWHVEHHYALTVGELTNGCSEPTGVQLQLIFRDGARDAPYFCLARKN